MGCSEISLRDPSPGPHSVTQTGESPHLCCLITFTPMRVWLGAQYPSIIDLSLRSGLLLPPLGRSRVRQTQWLPSRSPACITASSHSLLVLEKSVGNFILILKQSLSPWKTPFSVYVQWIPGPHTLVSKYFCQLHSLPLSIQIIGTSNCHSIALSNSLTLVAVVEKKQVFLLSIKRRGEQPKRTSYMYFCGYWGPRVRRLDHQRTKIVFLGQMSRNK